MERLTIVVRADLPPGDVLAQTAHAVAEFAEKYPEPFLSWKKASNTLLIKSVPSEGALASLRLRLISKRAEFAEFREPDMNNAMTSIALVPGFDILARDLPLALR